MGPWADTEDVKDEMGLGDHLVLPAYFSDGNLEAQGVKITFLRS